jgi:hypothetical protein
MPQTTDITIQIIRQKYSSLVNCLNEKSRRIWAATEAKSIGRGGITIVHKATGLDYKTIRKGIADTVLNDDIGTIRQCGGGRKKLVTKNSSLPRELELLVDPVTRGDPESALLWTSKSTYKLAAELNAKGIPISQKTVYSLLVDLDYSLQSNRKRHEGTEHPDRNEQFEYIYRKINLFQRTGDPTISVDTKKKENIGNYKNSGAEYHKKLNPTEVNMHDFPDKELGKVAPYGVYDIGKNAGWVCVGISSDTAEFAVNTIRCWWHVMGKKEYSKCRRILITADCGGSNGNRVKLWKYELQKLANEIGITIHVSHFPPGTSKWNKIEHRMFSYITANWRGRPLISREAVVQLIANTTTTTGLKIKAVLDENDYTKGIKLSDDQLSAITEKKDQFHGEWNYQIIDK